MLLTSIWWEKKNSCETNHRFWSYFRLDEVCHFAWQTITKTALVVRRGKAIYWILCRKFSLKLNVLRRFCFRHRIEHKPSVDEGDAWAGLNYWPQNFWFSRTCPGAYMVLTIVFRTHLLEAWHSSGGCLMGQTDGTATSRSITWRIIFAKLYYPFSSHPAREGLFLCRFFISYTIHTYMCIWFHFLHLSDHRWDPRTYTPVHECVFCILGWNDFRLHCQSTSRREIWVIWRSFCLRSFAWFCKFCWRAKAKTNSLYRLYTQNDTMPFGLSGVF